MLAAAGALSALGASLASVIGSWVVLIATRCEATATSSCSTDALWGGFPVNFRAAFLGSAVLAYVLNTALVTWISLSDVPDSVKWATAGGTLAYYALASACAPLLAWAVAARGGSDARKYAVRALLAVAVIPMGLVALMAHRSVLAGETDALGWLKGALALIPLAHVTLGDALLFSAFL